MLKLAAIFAAVFIAELGDKTQLAVLLFAGDRAQNPVLVFLAASAALVVATGIAVLIGSQGARYLEMVPGRALSGNGAAQADRWARLHRHRRLEPPRSRPRLGGTRASRVTARSIHQPLDPGAVGV